MRPLLLATTLLLPVVVGIRSAVAQENRAGPVRPISHLQTVASLRGRYRPLLVFAPASSEAFCQQVRVLADHRSELHDRDVAIYYLVAHNAAGSTRCQLPAPDLNTFAEPKLPGSNGGSHLFRTNKVDPNLFTVILIGKDGGKKLRARRPISFEELRDTIDAMPMRQRETRQRTSP